MSNLCKNFFRLPASLLLIGATGIICWLGAPMASLGQDFNNTDNTDDPSIEENEPPETAPGINAANANPTVSSWFSTYDEQARSIRLRPVDQQGLERVLSVMSTTPTPDAASAKDSISRLQQGCQKAFSSNLTVLPETAALYNLFTEYVLRSNDFYRDLNEALDGTVNSGTAEKFRQLKSRKRNLDASYAEIQRVENELRLKYNIAPPQKNDQNDQ